MLHLLFDNRQSFLAEVFTQRGALSRIILTREGQEVIADHVEAWQMRGVPVHREIPHGEGHQVYVDRVSPRTAQFLEAMQLWASWQAFHVMEMPEVYAAYWPRLMRLPFTPPERLAFLWLLRETAPEELSQWDRPLEEAQRVAVQAPDAAATPLHKALKKKSPFVKGTT